MEMKKLTNSTRGKRLVLAAFAGVSLLIAGQLTVLAQTKYKPGDRVQCNFIGSSAPQHEKYYEPGTVMAFRPNDQPDGSWYRVKADSNKVEYYCKIEHIRPIGGGTKPPAGGTKPPKDPVEEPPQETDEENEIPDGAGFVECPIEQKQVKNGSRPNAELLKKIIRCAKGEKAVEKGDEGAVKVDISAILIGTSRPWSPSRDSGNGKASTIVYPVKATYTVTTFYRTATEVEEGWIRILNFYVNAFGEWQIGSEEQVKSPKVKRIQK
jgi:hypothetical protein